MKILFVIASLIGANAIAACPDFAAQYTTCKMVANGQDQGNQSLTITQADATDASGVAYTTYTLDISGQEIADSAASAPGYSADGVTGVCAKNTVKIAADDKSFDLTFSKSSKGTFKIVQHDPADQANITITCTK